MDLIYYYPVGWGAPANVARTVFTYLQKRRKELPFENLKLFTKAKDAEVVRKQFCDLEVITYKDLKEVSNDSLIHIPISPLLMPNSKFLLHLFAVLKRRMLILQYHGDTRTEINLRFKYQHSLNMSYIPSYIALPYLLKSADKLIVHSHLMSNLVRGRYRVKNDIVIPNGIDDFWFDKSSNITNIELEGEPNIFYHGRLSTEKGVDMLINGFSKAIGERSTARLYIAAEGPQRGYLENLCIKLGIEKKVVFLGHIQQKDIKAYLSKIDAAIYPSIYDSFSLAVLEAFSSANCPVYFSKQTGIYGFVVRDGYGLKVFVPTVENIAEIIKEVIERKHNVTVVKYQKEFARRYTWDEVISQYIGLYLDMCVSLNAGEAFIEYTL